MWVDYYCCVPFAISYLYLISESSSATGTSSVVWVEVQAELENNGGTGNRLKSRSSQTRKRFDEDERGLEDKENHVRRHRTSEDAKNGRKVSRSSSEIYDVLLDRKDENGVRRHSKKSEDIHGRKFSKSDSENQEDEEDQVILDRKQLEEIRKLLSERSSRKFSSKGSEEAQLLKDLTKLRSHMSADRRSENWDGKAKHSRDSGNSVQEQDSLTKQLEEIRSKISELVLDRKTRRVSSSTASKEESEILNLTRRLQSQLGVKHPRKSSGRLLQENSSGNRIRSEMSTWKDLRESLRHELYKGESSEDEDSYANEKSHEHHQDNYRMKGPSRNRTYPYHSHHHAHHSRVEEKKRSSRKQDLANTNSSSDLLSPACHLLETLIKKEKRRGKSPKKSGGVISALEEHRDYHVKKVKKELSQLEKLHR